MVMNPSIIFMCHIHSCFHCEMHEWKWKLWYNLIFHSPLRPHRASPHTADQGAPNPSPPPLTHFNDLKNIPNPSNHQNHNINPNFYLFFWSGPRSKMPGKGSTKVSPNPFRIFPWPPLTMQLSQTLQNTSQSISSSHSHMLHFQAGNLTIDETKVKKVTPNPNHNFILTQWPP